jgi:hypothetical protein
MIRYLSVLVFLAPLFASTIDLHDAVVVVRPGTLPNAEKTAAIVLVEEIEKRTGVHLNTSSEWPTDKPVIAITSIGSSVTKPDGYRLLVDQSKPQVAIRIMGADPRGALFGVGNLLRVAGFAKGKLSIDSPLDIATSPKDPIRGHQLGYRTQANSYDAWTPHQFEQYIRELTFFGANSIEGIPFQDIRPTKVMKFSRRDMNRDIGEICNRYGLDYWVWIPADFDLKDQPKRAELLARSGEFFQDTPELTGIFFPGGDPGNNPPELVLPFLEDVAKILLPLHPRAKIWMSMQMFSNPQQEFVYQYIERTSPKWFGGLVGGPSSAPLSELRAHLGKQYMVRDYPDITHNKLSQYEVPEWDPAYARTLGREAVNPRPAEYAAIHNRTAVYTDGFISYSDGAHDDINKAVWSALAWDPTRDVRDILIEYARVYFDTSVGEKAADGILALERNWRGPLLFNGAVEGTLLQWQQMEKIAPQLESNWRWQMCLLRANYDSYDRRRLIYESKVEDQVNSILMQSPQLGAERSIVDATAVLYRGTDISPAPELRARIIDLCAKLFQSIGLQSSVEQYYASDPQRGAVLDFIDTPLNNRWWLEDQFKEVRALHTEAEKDARLVDIAKWEHPGPGSFYDNPGDVSKSPHVLPETSPSRTFWWWDQGRSRARLTWQVTRFPREMAYDGLDPHGTYVVRTTGAGQSNLRINGERVTPTVDGSKMGEFKEFPVDPKFLKSGKIALTWDKATGEENLNWRNKSRLAEVWLLKKDIH